MMSKRGYKIPSTTTFSSNFHSKDLQKTKDYAWLTSQLARAFENWREKKWSFSKQIAWRIVIFSEITKNEEKVKIDNYFSKHAYKRAFWQNSRFLAFPACRMAKKGSKTLETKGGTLEFFFDFGHFGNWSFFICFPTQKFF